ncbi:MULTISPECIES: type II toxin-antitoxin system RelE/ParE family toxin [Brucella/Ochrobactrum group]|uniref:type II toxin-antitoxin system RelE/ParE family toxin n=1 Tax=Brucella/Ochrobactrum group TaxID=2826938 RepID=UPI000D70708D|nr:MULTISPECIES: type II toxin-antitoxin system RelE/ParE family toxin [Brucella/Ochrobactrum group]KAB2784516.1 type II toxin-antitoxin system RelE/ParE family toxin [Brucella anthropi]MCH4544059.1 type II toxin-antitoxin system RelE/ParE family toxin [Ochrobactrum sp. A-1]PWU71172.1 type II toxin-antitoxin system RelE/ParE family toxin [Ochrobactrum sp. POC9]QOD67028.1 type II toxin-antitoxin system RelE/ParE family toxin [Ochrobactrum sp. MT180101]
MRFDGYQLTPLAEADLEDIWVYTLREWSLEQANSYITDVMDAFEGLRDDSKRGRFADIRPGYLKYAVGSHVIYFREHENTLLVVRILHGRMDVGRHM